MICLYSWNKGELLEQSLRSLAASDIGNNPIRVLLNGCTDDSLARVERVRALFPHNDFAICELPINIGAPQARNWLLALPETRACDHVAFLDDDVDVPADWLTRYLTVMESDPRIGIVGGKAVFPTAGNTAPELQYLYRYVSLAAQGILKLSIAAPPGRVRDTGLYSFTRPCLNVMGCLHLLRTAMLEDVGGFDLRFSPSQLDDIDHDLIAALRGWKVMYCGTVTCTHHQNSGMGAQTRQSLASFGSIAGNDLKLSYKHVEHFDKLARLSQEFLDQEPPGGNA